jgi:heme exporter protein C
MQKDSVKSYGVGLALGAMCVALFFLSFGVQEIASWSPYLLLLLIPLAFVIAKFRVYKGSTISIMFFVIYEGLTGEVPHLLRLLESIRNLYFHVPMWFAMVIILLVSMIFSIMFLRTSDIRYHVRAKEFAYVGLLLGILGLVTGMIWAQFTWGSFWSGDPKQNAAAIGVLMYFGYAVLLVSFNDHIQQAKVGAVFNVFAYPLFLALIFVLPRLVKSSLHPGIGGNPAFSDLDLNSNMRMVFYPAIIGWTLVAVWIADIRIQIQDLINKKYDI